MEGNVNNVVYRNNNGPYIVIIILLVIIAVLAFFVGASYKGNNLLGVNNSSNEGVVDSKDLVIKVIGDKRCVNCNTSEITTQLKNLPFLSQSKFEEVDFADKGVPELLKANNIEKLPAYLFNTNKINDTNYEILPYLKQTPSGMYALSIPATHDPYNEVCDNNVDDNGDGLVDCNDPKCGSSLKCSPKVKTPVADLYVMSYCPYGLQAEKGYLEVMDKLGKVADINIKYVPYIMHGQKEADENVVQYCIQKEQEPKYLKYLKCFLEADGKGEACKKEAGIDEKMLNSCVDVTKKEFQVDENMKSGKQFPDFTIDREEALKAGVEGSPTFVLNGIKVESVGRDARSMADAICSTFENRPAECDLEFQNVTFDPMFGFTSNGSAADAGCNPL